MDDQADINRMRATMDNMASPAAENISPYMSFIGNHIIYAYAGVVYLGALTLGLYYHSFFGQSPLIQFISKGTGILASAISWIPAFFVGGVVFNKFQFAKDTLNLYIYDDFTITSAIIFLSIPVGLFLKRIIVRFISPLLFWIFAVGSVVLFSLVVEYVGILQNNYSYLLAFCVIGVLYYFIIKQR